MKQKKNLSVTMFTLLFDLAFIALGNITVHAAVKVPKDEVAYFTQKTISIHYGSFQVKGMKKNQKITSAKSSNEKVLNPEGVWRDKDGRVFFGYFYFKPGTATVSFKIGEKTLPDQSPCQKIRQSVPSQAFPKTAKKT